MAVTNYEKNTMCISKPKTPEEQIKWLERESKDLRFDKARLEDELKLRDERVRHCVAMISELYGCVERGIEADKFQVRRMDEYRTALCDIREQCREVMNKYEGARGSMQKELYEFASTIMKITGRF